MPNPCPPHAFTRNFGPFQVGFSIDLPHGYVDQMIDLDESGMVKISEVQNTLTRSLDEHPPELAVAFNDTGTTTVYCGTGSSVIKGRPPLSETSAETDIWTAVVWIYAPFSPSDFWLDYPYIAQLWVASLDQVQIPGRSFLATLTTTETAYQLPDGSFGILPADYTPSGPQAGGLG